MIATRTRSLLSSAIGGLAALVLVGGLAAAPASATTTDATSSADVVEVLGTGSAGVGEAGPSPRFRTDSLPRTGAPSSSRVASAEEITIAGTVGIVDGSGAPVTDERLAAVAVRLVDQENTTIARSSGPTFSFTADSGRDYFIQVVGGAGVADAWYGDSPIAYRAKPVSGSASGLVITTGLEGTISGSIARFSFRHTVQAWYVDPVEGLLFELGETSVQVTTDTPYSIGELPPGDYIVRAVQADSQKLEDQYFSNADRLAGATTVRVGSGETRTGIDFSLNGYTWYTGRIAGVDRYATSVATSQKVFSPRVPVLYVANGANWPDALSAGPAAAALSGALLLTDPNGLPPIVADEIRRLEPERIVVVGSNASITDSTYAQISALAPTTTRIGGIDRYDTSRRIVADAFPDGALETLFLATGTNYPDALAVAPAAGWLGEPVLLVDGATSAVDAPTAASIRASAPAHIEMIGGTPSIGAAYGASVSSNGFAASVTRIAGVHRYDTSVRINTKYPGDELQDTAFLANGYGYADALAGATAAAAIGSPIYLANQDCVPRGVLSSMRTTGHNYVFLLGGEPSLRNAVLQLQSCGF